MADQMIGAAPAGQPGATSDGTTIVVQMQRLGGNQTHPQAQESDSVMPEKNQPQVN